MSEVVVMHLITRYLNGGAETTTDNAIEALREGDEDYELHLGTGKAHDPERLADTESDGVQTVVFRSLRHYNPIGAIVSVFAIAWYLYCNDIDVLHTHSTEAGIAGRWAAYLARTPFIIHEIHGDPVAEDRHPLLNAFVLTAERISAPITDQFVVKSERIREAFLERGIGKPGQYELIYHGVDLERFREAEANGDLESEGTLDILYAGRLAEGKGINDLLDAIERLDDVRLRLAGDGPIYNSLETEVEQRELPVELLGYRDDIPALMTSADVLVLPSYREGTPRVITEALAAGCPVIATDIAGIPEQVEDGKTGLLYSPGDVDALVDAFSTLQADESLSTQMSSNCLYSVSKFSKEESARDFKDLYSSLKI